MLFNSYIFVFLFFPICLIGWFSLNHYHKFKAAQVFLFGMSLWFYGYFNPSYLPIILVSIAVNYVLTLGMLRSDSRKVRGLELALAIAFNLGLIFYFKYFDFFLENVNRVFRQDFPLRHILLPLGISFFTFQQLSYVIDTYRGEVKQYDFWQYACFVTYIPQLIAGPIVTHDELVPQFEDESKKHFQWDNFAPGLYLFAMGLGKKVLIADTFGRAADYGFSPVSLMYMDSTDTLLAMLAYTIQIYFDFSGYCDMAIGIGRMMNIELPVNFDSPYKALTITEFWKRWHKTLTRFFTKYVYIPLGGSRKGMTRTCVNVLIVFAVSGLWHGASWTFILWGILHGIFMVITRIFKKQFDSFHPVFNWLMTFSFVNFAWTLFRAESIHDAVWMIKKVISMDFGPINSQITEAFCLPELRALLDAVLPFDLLTKLPQFFLLAFFAGAFWLMLGCRNAHERMETFRPTLATALWTVILLGWCVFSFAGVSSFLYFNF